MVVAPESWIGFQENGASIANFRDGYLVIVQTQRVHEQIELFLARLRDLLARQAEPRRRKRVFRLHLGPAETPIVKRLRERLAKPISLDFGDTPFEQAIDILRERTGLNIVVHQRALAAEGIGPDTTVTLKAKNVPARRALDLICDQVNLDWEFRHDVVFVTYESWFAFDVELRGYGVRDLVVHEAGGGGTEPTLDSRDLVSFIENVVVPESWTDGFGCIETFREEVFVITARTSRVHDDIWDLLNVLCEALSPPEGAAGEARQRVWRVGPYYRPAAKRIRQQLARQVTLDFANTPFEHVIAFLTDLTKVRFIVDKRAMEAEKIGPKTTITFKVSDVRLADALTLILEQVNLDFVMKDEVIFVTNREGASKDLDVRLYDVHDLAPPVKERGEAEARRARGRVDARGAGDSRDDGEDDIAEAPGPLDDVVHVIQWTIEPASWENGGDGFATIAPFRDRLLAISQTPKAHEQIEALLTQLRAAVSGGPASAARLKVTHTPAGG